MRTTFCFLSLVLLATLAGCNSTPREVASSPADKPAQTAEDPASKADQADGDQAASDKKISTKDRPKPIEPALKPGEYCYASSSDSEDIQTRITVEASDRITGDMAGSIQDEKAGYYTSYRRALNGTIDGRNLNLDIATWIEYDQQNTQETWKVGPNELRTDRETLSGISCDGVNKAFQNENGLEAKDLTESANRVKTAAVFFDADTNGTTVSGAVVRGDRDLYTLTAQGGQQMFLSISSLENNAVFDVVDPSGIILGTERVEDMFFLPHTGEYQIIVGGTRGNATYDLAIAIE